MSILTAEDNSLNELPPKFGALCFMVTLDLSKNMLVAKVDLKSMSNLRFVDLSYNSLLDFPELPIQSQLDQLMLGHNKIHHINNNLLLRAASSLTVLNMRSNQLSDIPPAISKLEKLKILDIANNHLTDLPQGTLPFAFIHIL
jgi:hypothetical protein